MLPRASDTGVRNVIVSGVVRGVFSSASVIDNTIFVSGTLGTLGETFELVAGGVGPQTKQTLDNIRTILHGVMNTDVGVIPVEPAWQLAKLNISLSGRCVDGSVDESAYADFNAAYKEWFGVYCGGCHPHA